MADLSLPILLLFTAMGAVGGLLAGLLGIGGGMFLVPALTLIFAALGVAPQLCVKMAVATSLASILATSASSVAAHHRRGAVLWPVALRLAPGLVLGSVLGPFVARALSAQTMTIAFAVFVTYSAVQLLMDRKPKPTRELPGTWGLAAVGSCIGILSSLVGAGGGFVSVPFMTWCNVRIHNAVATSAALGLPIAFAGTTGYVLSGWDLQGAPPFSLGYIYLPALLAIAAASVLLAPVGARLAHQMNVRQLKRAFALLLLALAATMVARV
jgi:uncharacterized protein